MTAVLNDHLCKKQRSFCRVPLPANIKGKMLTEVPSSVSHTLFASVRRWLHCTSVPLEPMQPEALPYFCMLLYWDILGQWKIKRKLLYYNSVNIGDIW